MAGRMRKLADDLAARFGGRLAVTVSRTAEVTAELAPDDLLEVVTALRDQAEFRFEEIVDVCGVDYLAHGKDEWLTGESTNLGFSRGVDRDAQLDDEPDASAHPRFAVVYHLLSVSTNRRLRLRCRCPDDEVPMVPSLVEVHPGVNWFEREAFDLYGILFDGHPDLRRILTDYGFIGHPFRKDFPLSGNVEVRYDPTRQRVIYQPVSIAPRTLVPKVIREDHRYDIADSGKGRRDA